MEKNKSVTEDRERYIGGSDIPIILGISPYKKRFKLLKEKLGETPEFKFEGNDYTDYGDELEPIIRNYINEKIRVSDAFSEDYFIGNLSNNEDKLKFRCNVDGVNSSEILEIKTTSNVKSNVNDYKLYLVQLLFYMMHVGKEKGILAVYERTDFDIPEKLDSSRLQVFYIDKKDYKDLLEEIKEGVDSFQNDLLRLRENPNLTEEDLINPLVVECSKKVIELENYLKGYKSVELKLKDLKLKLFNAMKNHNVKSWITPNGVKISRVDESQYERVSLDVEKIKKQEPKVYEKYKNIKKIKRKGYVKLSIMTGDPKNEFEKIEGDKNEK